MMKYYTRRYGFCKQDRLTIQIDLTQSTAPIRMTWEDRNSDGKYSTCLTPFQTASAGHDLNAAFRLCRKWTG